MVANERAAGGGDPPALDTVPTLGPAAYAAELAAMVDRPFCFSEKYREQQGRAERTGAQPAILEFERLLVKRAFKLGVPLWAHCVYRGADEQNRLYVQGVSKAKAGQSAHNFGCAVDIVHGTKAWNLTAKQWAIIGHLGREVAASSGYLLTWGGDDPGVDDKFNWDPAHWELTDWRDYRKYLASEGLY